MTIKTILPFGDPVLRKTARPAELPLTPRMGQLLDDMAETLYASDGRAGLAAPQVGILRRLIVMDCGDGLIELINPVILSMSGEQTGPEGCLSYPGYYGMVTRAEQVAVQTFTREGEEKVIEAEGYLARCIQHEIDHLNGILYIDHVKEQWLYNEHTRQRVPLFEAIRTAAVT
jgi:peptide deformylase